MRDQREQKECVAVIGSMTQAMQAQNALASAAIRAEVIKADSSEGGRGCAYGVRVSCRQLSNVEAVLRHAGIRVRSYYGGGGMS